MPFTSRLPCDMQPVYEDFHTQSGIFQLNCVCSGVPCCMVSPVPLDMVGPAAHLTPWMCRDSGTLATWGWLCMLHGSLTASQQWQSSVEQCPGNTAFSKSTKHKGLHALPMDMPEISSTWLLRPRGHAALAELC